MLEIQAHDLVPGMVIAPGFTHPGAPEQTITAVNRRASRFVEGEFEYVISYLSPRGPHTSQAYEGKYVPTPHTMLVFPQQYIPIVSPTGPVKVYRRIARDGQDNKREYEFDSLTDATYYARAVRGIAHVLDQQISVTVEYSH